MCLLENAGSAHVSRLINRYGGECPFAASGSAAVRLPDRDHKAESFYGFSPSYYGEVCRRRYRIAFALIKAQKIVRGLNKV